MHGVEGCALAALPSQLCRLKDDASIAAFNRIEAQDEPQCAVAASQADIWPKSTALHTSWYVPSSRLFQTKPVATDFSP